MPDDERGFAGMGEEKRSEIAAKGGRASHEKGTGHEFGSREASEAGEKGGEASGGRSGGRQGGSRGGSGGSTGREIEHHMEDKGMKQDQAVAAALSEKRREKNE